MSYTTKQLLSLGLGEWGTKQETNLAIRKKNLKTPHERRVGSKVNLCLNCSSSSCRSLCWVCHVPEFQLTEQPHLLLTSILGKLAKARHSESLTFSLKSTQLYPTQLLPDLLLKVPTLLDS